MNSSSSFKEKPQLKIIYFNWKTKDISFTISFIMEDYLKWCLQWRNKQRDCHSHWPSAQLVWYIVYHPFILTSLYLLCVSFHPFISLIIMSILLSFHTFIYLLITCILFLSSFHTFISLLVMHVYPSILSSFHTFSYLRITCILFLSSFFLFKYYVLFFILSLYPFNLFLSTFYSFFSFSIILSFLFILLRNLTE